MPQSAIDQPTKSDSSPLIKPTDVSQMASDLFTAMLGMPFDPALIEACDISNDALQSFITIDGSWNAEFRIVVPQKLASLIACAMFGIDESELTCDEIFDALGEVVNVIGGNAKGIVDQDCNLSLPCIGKYEPVLNPCQWQTLTYDCAGQPFTVLIHESTSS
jgi:chemotaxis protein CheX